MRKISGISLIVLILVGIVILFQDYVVSLTENLISNDYAISNSILINQESGIENKTKIRVNENGYFILEELFVKSCNEQGTEMWQKSINSSNVVSDISDNYIVIGEKKAGDLYILNSEGKIEAFFTELGEIEDIKFLSDEYILVNVNSEQLVLFDVTLRIICSIYLPDGEVLGYGFNIDKEYIVTSILDIDESQFNSKVIVSEFNGTIVSGVNFEEEIIFFTEILDDGYFIVTDTGMYSYDYRGKIKWGNSLSDDVTFVKMYEGQIFVYIQLAGNESENKEESKIIQIYDIDGNFIKNVNIENKEILDFEVMSDQLMILSEECLEFVDFNGKIKEKYELDENPMAIHKMNDNSFGIEYINYLNIYNDIRY